MKLSDIQVMLIIFLNIHHILMQDLDPTAMKPFYKSFVTDANEATKVIPFLANGLVSKVQKKYTTSEQRHMYCTNLIGCTCTCLFVWFYQI